jgi:hypothetical protein
MPRPAPLLTVVLAAALALPPSGIGTGDPCSDRRRHPSQAVRVWGFPEHFR